MGLVLLTLLVTNLGLFYGYTEMKKTPSSISALWFSDIHFIYRLTIIAISMLFAMQGTALMGVAGACLMGILVFPNIHKKKEKMVHDGFAVAAFVLIGLEVHWGIPLLLLFIFLPLRKKLSLYWLEIIGLNIVYLASIIKTLL